ncbi:MAG: arginase family protein [bacterium]|nr:arginase family protein [bacterium]
MRPLILHFDDVYLYQRRLRSIGEELDLREVEGIRYLCPLEKLEELDRRIPRYRSSIAFIGSGDFHYITYLFLRRIREPFNLLLIDNHLDINGTFDGFISCGSWLKDALNNRHLRYVFYIGPYVNNSKRIIRVGKDLEELSLSVRMGIPFYISIDKDILDSSIIETNWEQGHLTLEELFRILSYIPIDRIIGIDICGEPRPDPFSPYLKKSEEINLKIVDIFFRRKDRRILA